MTPRAQPDHGCDVMIGAAANQSIQLQFKTEAPAACKSVTELAGRVLRRLSA